MAQSQNRTQAEMVIERALAAVAASRARREAEARRRQDTFDRIQLATIRKPSIPKGIQLRLDLN